MTGVQTDEDETYYQIEFDDCDREELDVGQIWDAVIYHPRMDDLHETTAEHPAVGTFALFAQDQRPRIGKVTAIDLGAMKPVTVQLWKPNKHCGSIDKGRFKPSVNADGPDQMMLQGSQIKLRNLSLTEEGYLDRSSRAKVRKLLKPKETEKVTPGHRKRSYATKVTPGKKVMKGRPTSKSRTTRPYAARAVKPEAGSSKPAVSPKESGKRISISRKSTRQSRYNLRRRY